MAHHVVPENIHTPPTEGIGISWGLGGEVLEKLPSMGKVWIFSGTTDAP